MSNSKKILFIGGTKFIGAKLVDKFLADGHSIYIFSRSAPTQALVTYIKGDRNNPEDLETLRTNIEKLSFDCIYDMCCYVPDQARSFMNIVAKHAKKLVFFSSAAVYARIGKFPLREDSELGEHLSFGDYGTNKAAIEKIYTKVCSDNNINLTIFRPHYILGAGDYFERHPYFFSRLEANHTFKLPGKGNALLQFAYYKDVVEMFYKVPFLQDKSVEILNLAGEELFTLHGVINEFANKVNIEPQIEEVNYETHGLKEDYFYDELFPFPNLNLILDSSLAIEKYGYKPRGLESYMQELLEDWQANKQKHSIKPNLLNA